MFEIRSWIRWTVNFAFLKKVQIRNFLGVIAKKPEIVFNPKLIRGMVWGYFCLLVRTK